MKFDPTSKTIQVSPREALIYVPLLLLTFSAGIAWAMTTREIDDKADKIAVKVVDDSLGRAVTYQAGRLDRAEAEGQTAAAAIAELRADMKAGLSILCENFPAQQTRLSQIRCAAK